MTKSFLDVFLKPRESLYKASQKLSDPLFIDKAVQGGMDIAANVFPGIPAITEGFKQGGIGGAVSNWNAEFDKRNLNPMESAMKMGEGFLNPTGFTGSLKNVGKGAGKELTSKIIQRLEGRPKGVVSKQYIQDLAKMDDIKQAEKNIVDKALGKIKSTKVDLEDFIEKVKGDLLPLKITKTGGNQIGEKIYTHNTKYENISLPDDLKGNVANYSEHIYKSPVKTSAGNIHFGDMNIENYFGHTRIEDLIDMTKDGSQMKGTNYHGTTRRIIEIQFDLFQKGNLEKSVFNPGSKEFPYLTVESDDLKNFPGQAEKLSKLKPYQNTWHERIIREEVKQAAKDGKTKLQFPTGETAMKIEGLGDGQMFTLPGAPNVRNSILQPTQLKTGLQVESIDGGQWIITDVLGDGKFKAVPKEKLDYFAKDKPIGLGKKEWTYDNLPPHMQHLVETFDISGKVDINNPIYKFYEKDLGKYLKNKYQAKLITDKQGVSWYELNVPKEAKSLPIEAFGFGAMLNKKQEEKAKQRQELFISR